jgi:Zn-dependent protease with chaperone function
MFRVNVRSDPWVWASLGAHLAAAYLIARGSTWLGMRVALRAWLRSQSDHWSEQARRSWRGRRLGRLSLLVVPAPILAVVLSRGVHLQLLPGLVMSFLFMAVIYIGILGAAISWDRKINPAVALTPGGERGAWISSFSLLGTLLLIGFVLYGLADRFHTMGAWTIVAAGILLAFAHLRRGWLLLMRKSGIMRPGSQRLLSVVARLADATGVHPKAAFQVALPMANAFAFLQARSIGVTDAALATLSDDELACVCAHELAHLSEPFWVRAVRLSSLLMLALLVSLPAAVRPLFQTFGSETMFLVLGVIYVIVLCWLILFGRVYRRMEVRADRIARETENAPGVYARALEKIHQVSLIPVVIARRKHRYPELYDRMVEAGAPPAYARPAPPPRAPFYLGLVTELAAAVGGAFCLIVVRAIVGQSGLTR